MPDLQRPVKPPGTAYRLYMVDVSKQWAKMTAEQKAPYEQKCYERNLEVTKSFAHKGWDPQSNRMPLKALHQWLRDHLHDILADSPPGTSQRMLDKEGRRRWMALPAEVRKSLLAKRASDFSKWQEAQKDKTPPKKQACRRVRGKAKPRRVGGVIKDEAEGSQPDGEEVDGGSPKRARK
mmetsp:Transcript_8184/g.23373  ORF Transcript_8184/g.23373 Transcript_8184/m.23373 type:complete len:179 (-) Transcript_8184:199-735(-)